MSFVQKLYFERLPLFDLVGWSRWVAFYPGETTMPFTAMLNGILDLVHCRFFHIISIVFPHVLLTMINGC